MVCLPGRYSDMLLIQGATFGTVVGITLEQMY